MCLGHQWNSWNGVVERMQSGWPSPAGLVGRTMHAEAVVAGRGIEAHHREMVVGQPVAPRVIDRCLSGTSLSLPWGRTVLCLCAGVPPQGGTLVEGAVDQMSVPVPGQGLEGLEHGVALAEENVEHLLPDALTSPRPDSRHGQAHIACAGWHTRACRLASTLGMLCCEVLQDIACAVWRRTSGLGEREARPW